MFGFRKKDIEKDEAQIYLENRRDEPEMPDPAEVSDTALTELARSDAEAHYNVINLLVLAAVLLTFGVALLTLTNKQDFSNENAFTKENFLSGNYFAKIERTFRESIPLRDYLHNAESYIKYCFGYGNKLDLVEIADRSKQDDPYSIDDSEVDDGMLADSKAQQTEKRENTDSEIEIIQNDDEDSTPDKKLDTITLRVTTTTGSSESETQSSTTTNNDPPGATTTTTVPPETSRDIDTEPVPTDTEPTDTQPPDVTSSSEDSSDESND